MNMATKLGRPVGPQGAKTVVLSLKVTPKVRFGLEMLSRMRNTSVPDLVTRAVTDLFDSESIGLWVDDDKRPDEDFAGRRYLLDELWAERPSDRFANIALRSADLCTIDERGLWLYVEGQPKYWTHKKLRTEKEFLRDALALDWDELKSAYLPQKGP
jgi:hypothetical protein